MQSSTVVLPMLPGTLRLRIGSCALFLGILSAFMGCSGTFLRGAGSKAVIKSYPTETAASSVSSDEDVVLPAASYMSNDVQYYSPHPIDQSTGATEKPSFPEIPDESLPHDEAVTVFMAEVQAAGLVHPGTEARLVGQLKASDRKLWPLVVQQHQSAVAYSQELLAKQQRQLAAKSTTSRRQQFPSMDSGTDNAVPSPALVETTPSEKQLGVKPALDSIPQTFTNVEQPLAEENQAATTSPIDEPSLADGLPPATHDLSSLSQPMHQASYQALVKARDGQSLGWREHLEAALTDLERAVPNQPGSTDELQEHMRLRMLRLMAGQEEACYEPIPGASAIQQDYWSKQLFAVSTFLDSDRMPDMKQRAAGSLMHLDQARAKLAEMASLQVRNATFVSKVDGYGMYEPQESNKFRPGDQVTIYAEVENFRSESSQDGYRTALSTSYEVVDPHDRRIDGAQFPEVEDYCKNVRRDFHMQYGVALPTRIYPGEYELRLVITDQLSNKIGQATIAFEIVD